MSRLTALKKNKGFIVVSLATTVAFFVGISYEISSFSLIQNALAQSLQSINIGPSTLIKVRIGPPNDQLHYTCTIQSTSTTVPTPTSDVVPTATPIPSAEPSSEPSPTPTDIPEVSVTPGPTIPAGDGLWVSQSVIDNLPENDAWLDIIGIADEPTGVASICDQTQTHDVRMVAKALVFAKNGQESYRQDVREGLEAAIGTEVGEPSDCDDRDPRTLALGWNLTGYVVAADLINLKEFDSTFDQNEFTPWLEEMLTKSLSGRTLISTQEDRPNNWGTGAGAARAAINVYIGDTADLEETANIFKGWMGDRSAYSSFDYGSDLSWQCDSGSPVGINPTGCLIEGIDMGGSQPEEMRRIDQSFHWPPEDSTGYPWTALQGAVAQAEILYNQGYDAWEWEDRALCRAVDFLYNGVGWEPESGGDDHWIVWIVNHRCGTEYPIGERAILGKVMDFTQWTHR